MKPTIKWAVLTVLASIFFHSYLTSHYYPLKYGAAKTESACNINETFNCDVVATSDFSAIMDIPLALFGAVTNSILLLLLLSVFLKLSTQPEKILRYSYGLAGIIAFPVIGLLSIYLGWQYIFIVFVLLGLLWLIPWWILVKSPPGEHPWITEEERDYILKGQQNQDLDEDLPF